MIRDVLLINPLLYLLVPFAFVIGSIPFGILFTRGRGIDLRNTGSRNIGATNVLRSAGKVPALLTLVCDVLKGVVPVLICSIIIDNMGRTAAIDRSLMPVAVDLWLGITGFSAVAGHIFSVFLSFRGGKGVATGLGVTAVYSPVSVVVLLVIWLGVAITTRYSSLAAIVAFTSLPVVFIISGASGIKIFFGALLALLIVYRHKSNIKNLLAGTESKIGKK
ncbi:MAG: glycerol-3-phosphate 1-O-acyltransferase PlsY [Deferribacteres bacterium]|nr:glycerol-3-phosphate 1-O-acyltransferase PlsY [Deferribacteres bacterium]